MKHWSSIINTKTITIILFFLNTFVYSFFFHSKSNNDLCSSTFSLTHKNHEGLYVNDYFFGVKSSNIQSYKTNLEGSSPDRTLFLIEYLNESTNKDNYIVYISDGRYTQSQMTCIDNDHHKISVFSRNTKENGPERRNSREFIKEKIRLGDDRFHEGLVSLTFYNYLMYLTHEENGILFFRSSKETKGNKVYVSDGSEGYYMVFEKEKSNEEVIKAMIAGENLLESELKNGFSYYLDTMTYQLKSVSSEDLYKDSGYRIMNLIEENENFERKILNFYINQLLSNSQNYNNQLEKIIKTSYILRFYQGKINEFKGLFNDLYRPLTENDKDIVEGKEFIKKSTGEFIISAELYRGIRKTKTINEFQVGRIVKSNKFLSTSLDFKIGDKFSHFQGSKEVLHFKPNPDCPIKVMCFYCNDSSIGFEKEVLLMSGLYFRVIERKIIHYLDDDLSLISFQPICDYKNHMLDIKNLLIMP